MILYCDIIFMLTCVYSGTTLFNTLSLRTNYRLCFYDVLHSYLVYGFDYWCDFYGWYIIKTCKWNPKNLTNSMKL